MLKEKYKGYISIIGIFLALIFVISSVFFIDSESKEEVAATVTNISEVLDKEKVTDIDIDIKESDWKNLIENATKEEYVNADITIDGQKYSNVGIRAKGNSSLSSVARDDTTDRYSFKIDFGEYIDGQTYNGIEKLALNNMISDATYMKEYLSYDMYNFLGVATPEYSYANINVNGEKWGLYLAVEVIDERFVEKNYGTSEGNLYKPETMNVGGKDEDNGQKPQGNKNIEQKPEINNENNGQAPMVPDMGGKEFDPNNNPRNQNGEIPEGFNPMENSEKEDFNSGQENSQNVNNNPPNNMIDKNINGDINAENKSRAMGMPGGKDNKGADLKYIDDNLDSYSIVRESAVFKKTSDKDFEKFVTMVKNLNEGTDIEKYINVEEVLKYFAVNTFLVNLDSYSGGMYHNYYLYEKDGVFEIIPWDLNTSFGGFAVRSGSNAVNFPINSPVTGSLENAPLIGKLLEVDEYKELYHQYLNKLVNEYVKNGEFESSVIKLDKLINNYVKLDPTAFYSYEEYKNSIPQIITFGTDRAKSVEAQLNREQSSTEYGNISTTLDLALLGGMGKDKNNQNSENNKAEEGEELSKEMANMVPMEKMKEVKQIINNKTFNELNDEEKSKLAELGIDESNFDKINSFNNQNRMPKEQNGMASINNGNLFNNKYIINVGISIIILLSSILFISKYRRKRY